MSVTGAVVLTDGAVSGGAAVSGGGFMLGVVGVTTVVTTGGVVGGDKISSMSGITIGASGSRSGARRMSCKRSSISTHCSGEISANSSCGSANISGGSRTMSNTSANTI